MPERDSAGGPHCEVCGCDLSDPKNAGDPDVNGDWVCRDPTCRAAHRPEMECNGCHLATDGGDR